MSRPRRCLVIHPGALGDVLLALPALAHLERLGYARVLAAAPRLNALLAACGVVEATANLDGLGLHRLFTTPADPATLATLMAHDAVVSWLGAGDPVYTDHLAGLDRPAVIARAAPPPGTRGHVSRHLVDALAPLGPVPATVPSVRLVAPPAARAWALAWLGARGLGPGEAVLLQAGAGSPAKVWPHLPVLARRLRVVGLPVVVIAGPADAAALARLETEVDGPMVARDLSLVHLLALAGLARVFVGHDSGPTHLAALTGCPTVALFGPSDPAVWAPGGDSVRVLAGPGPGAPDPWEGLEVDAVEAALTMLATPVVAARREPA